MLSPKDAEPVCAIWLEQLDRHKISPFLYELLLHRAVDTRSKKIGSNDNIPALTVELFISEFLKFKTEISLKINSYRNMNLEHDISRWKYQLEENPTSETVKHRLAEAESEMERRINIVQAILKENHLEENLSAY